MIKLSYLMTDTDNENVKKNVQKSQTNPHMNMGSCI